MKDELRINGKDAYTTWGISMDNNALSELMTPSSNKTFIENESRLEHGKRVVIANPRVDVRNLTLQINLTASSEMCIRDSYHCGSCHYDLLDWSVFHNLNGYPSLLPAFVHKHEYEALS